MAAAAAAALWQELAQQEHAVLAVSISYAVAVGGYLGRAVFFAEAQALQLCVM